jgi:tetratricopeptide (TPR) repeat protein
MSEILSPAKLSQEGTSAYQQSHYPEAARLFEQAARGYDAAGQKVKAAEARNNASVAFLKGGDPSEALRAVQGTAEIFAAAGEARLEGMAYANLACALDDQGKLKEALESYEKASDLLK